MDDRSKLEEISVLPGIVLFNGVCQSRGQIEIYLSSEVLPEIIQNSRSDNFRQAYITFHIATFEKLSQHIKTSENIF